MEENLIIGGTTMAICLALQCVVVSILLHGLLALEKRQKIKATLFHASLLLCSVMLVMLAGNFLQMALWAVLFSGCGEFETFAAAFYHSVVNFTTLGYGDVVMSEEKRLLGALEAANGVMMFGLTTSVLFAVLTALARRGWESHVAELNR